MKPRSLDVTAYPNWLQRINLNTGTVVNAIRSYRLTFLPHKSQVVEWQLRLPAFVPPFWCTVIESQRVPQQAEYWERYLAENATYFGRERFSSAVTQAIRARLYRTYPSLVRDLHFALLLREIATRSTIIYNPQLDMDEGIDLLVCWQDTNFAINLFTETKRAQYGRRKKAQRHRQYANVIPLELPVSLQNRTPCGDFFLYGERERDALIGRMRSHIK